jgi:hypothetical protein
MVSTRQLFQIIDTNGEMRRPPLVGMNFLNEYRAATPNCALLAQDKADKLFCSSVWIAAERSALHRWFACLHAVREACGQGAMSVANRTHCVMVDVSAVRTR